MLSPGDTVVVDTPDDRMFHRLPGTIVRTEDRVKTHFILVDLSAGAGRAWFAEHELRQAQGYAHGCAPRKTHS